MRFDDVWELVIFLPKANLGGCTSKQGSPPLFTELPRRGLLGNPLAAYREVMHPSDQNAPFAVL
jgi:hypothetical protein